MKGRLVIIIIGLAVIGGIAALLFFGLQSNNAGVSGTINFWGVYDDATVMSPLINDFKALYPRSKITINYTQIDPDIYEQKLVDTLAGIDGPDMFMFHNTWLPKHQNKIYALSSTQTELTNFQNLFPTVVQQDCAPDKVVYCYPLYVDTLAMYYNQDIFDAKTVSLPPKTWTAFEGLIPRLREMDKVGRITKAAGAVGGSNKSIDHASDLLNLMMLQTGTKMVTDNFSSATFGSAEGQNALAYYTKFANPRDSSYTWNDSLPYSLDSFAGGQTAVMFNYATQMAALRQKNPFLKFRVAPMLQPEGAAADVNFANYWALAISNKTKNYGLALAFIQYLTTNMDASRKYLTATGKPPALRALINDSISNQPDLGIFAKQALTARSWPEVDNDAVTSIFSGMIADVINGRNTVQRAISGAESQVTDLMRQKAR